MAALIDSAPECVTDVKGTAADRLDDSADFVLQANYEQCNGEDFPGGFMTFGPGETYGDTGDAAEAAYMILTWLGIAFMVAALLAWVVWEHRHLIAYAAGRVTGGRGGTRT
jgi:hypothetical protein